MEFGKFVKEVARDRTEEASPKKPEQDSKAETYKVSCVCTGIAYSESCMMLGPFRESCTAAGKSCLATGKS